MKKDSFKKLLIGILVGLSTLVSVGVHADTTIYRLYNRINGEHLYTADANEKEVLFRQHGWGYEGESWHAPDAGQGAPVYRLYNPRLQNHLYTIDTNEVAVLTSKHGWKTDNGGRPVFYSGGNVAIYRVYNKALRGLHHLTTDTNEYNVLPSHGWRQEGIKLNAIRVGVPIRTQYYEALPSGASNIENTGSQYTLEADVSVSGSGTGYHAKILAVSPVSGISFGLQYDVAARAPHTGKTSFMVENIGNNTAGGQAYQWTGLYAQNKGTTYHLMLAVQRDGSYAAYINGAVVAQGRNAAMANRTDIALRVEGSGRKNGDSINAVFSNIKLKTNGVYQANKGWGTHEFRTNPGIVAQGNTGRIIIDGTVTGLTPLQDWDNAYGIVSSIIQFVG